MHKRGHENHRDGQEGGVNASRRARLRRLHEHLAAGTYSPNRSRSHFTSAGVAEAMVEDIYERSRLPSKVRDPHWAFHTQPAPAGALVELLTP